MAQTPTMESNLSEVLKQVAREKDIDFERWITALEDAMASAAKKQHRIKEPVRARLDVETGQFDAFIVRMALIPALMYLLGEKAWWIPGWLDRLIPDVDVDLVALLGDGQRCGHARNAAAHHQQCFGYRIQFEGLFRIPDPIRIRVENRYVRRSRSGRHDGMLENQPGWFSVRSGK